MMAFDIGWDFARFGRPMDAAIHDAGLLTGYAAGRAHFQVAQHRPDRFVSKWLQLRVNAFKRRRILNAEVDPSYLARIDCDICPITLVTLTHSALCDSDWSVDRINNDGAYAPGNLMIMSFERTAPRVRRITTMSPFSLRSRRTVRPRALSAERRTLSNGEWECLACVMIGAAEVTEVAPTLNAAAHPGPRGFQGAAVLCSPADAITSRRSSVGP